MAKLSIRDVAAQGKEVLMRVDFNVPLKDGAITDDTRIEAALPSIRHLLEAGAKLVLCSHLGRPKGEPDPKYSLKPAADRLAEHLGQAVGFASDCIGDEAAAMRAGLEPGGVVLLENTRFHAGEKANEAGFAKELAGNAEIFVNDAFGTAHRAHGSTEGVTHHVGQSAMGFLIERELEYLQGKLESPEKPFLVIMGGAKVSDKIQVITSLMEKADQFIIGGAMAYTFAKAKGFSIGDSLVENDKLDLALEILKLAEEKGTEFLLPVDTLVTQEFKEGAATKVVTTEEGIEPGWQGVDIGARSVDVFSKAITSAKTVIWNGPMGVFEISTFAKGTAAIAKALAESEALSIVGGGDSVTAVKKFGFETRVDFISTGGGASLELLEGKELPGVSALSEI